jgi:hypothetical protein
MTRARGPRGWKYERERGREREREGVRGRARESEGERGREGDGERKHPSSSWPPSFPPSPAPLLPCHHPVGGRGRGTREGGREEALHQVLCTIDLVTSLDYYFYYRT